MPENKFNPPSTLAVTRAVGWVTFLEVIKDRILYNTVLCAFLLFGVAILGSRLAFLNPDRVIIDFGLSGVKISCTLIAIFTGASLLNREFERRTIYVALSHPISRGQFVLGKFAGLAAVLLCNWLLLSAAFLIILKISTGGFYWQARTSLMVGLALVLLQSVMVAAVAVFFSTFSTTSLASIFTIGIYLVGNCISQIKYVAARSETVFSKHLLNGLSYCLPNFEYYNLGTRVTYNLHVAAKDIAFGVSYGFCGIVFCLLMAGICIRQKEA